MQWKEQVLIGVLGTVDGHEPATDPTIGCQHREVLPVMAVMDPELPGAGLGHCKRRVRQGPGDEDRVQTGDGHLLSRDAGQVRSQILRVLDSDTGYDTDLRVNDVGGVQPPSEPDLEHRSFDRQAGEVRKCGRSYQLEIGV